MNEQKKIEWSEKLKIGIKEIDEQHQMLFKIANTVFDMIGQNPTKDQLAEVIGQLLDYTVYHFSTEEKYFGEFKYDKSEEHTAYHNSFETKVLELQNKYPDNNLELAIEIADFLENWLVEHIMHSDKEYVECFKLHGLK